MGRHALNKLTARKVQTTTKRGRYGDGGGLYLVVTPDGSRKWVYRFALHGRQRDMGLGAVRDVSLAEARSAATAARDHVRAGRDPISERDRARHTANVATFGEMAEQHIAAKGPGFRSSKYRTHWINSLRTHAAPIWSTPINAITTDDVLGCLEPIWLTKAVTASHVRGRIEQVLGAAAARGLRPRENPAQWRGHLETLLPRPQKLTRGHHPAVPYNDVPALVARLRETDGLPAKALEFAILTAVRTMEALAARWSEIDLEARLWIIPPTRTKQGRQHRVPLSSRASEILRELHASKFNEFVFPGTKPEKPLCHVAMLRLLRRLGRKETVHGFRSTVRDWAEDHMGFSREVAEAALAHTVGGQTERAYRRGDALEKRRELMGAWARFCAGETGNVVPLSRAQA